MHVRLEPRRHRFAYRIFWLALDLDELGQLGRRLRWLGIDRSGLLSFRQRDHLPTDAPRHLAASAETPAPNREQPLKTRLLAWLAAQGLDCPAESRVVLLTLPRVLGYVFNPVCFYFVSDRAGAPLACVAEVTNTFHETKFYLLGPETLDRSPGPDGLGPSFRLRTPKHFYVSPFSDVDVAFDFRLRPPGDRLAIQIDDRDGPRRTLVSTVTNLGPPRPLTDRALLFAWLRSPLLTLKVIAGIHWEAFRLWAKHVPWFSKSARAADQRDLYRPHPSIALRPDASSTPTTPAS